MEIVTQMKHIVRFIVLYAFILIASGCSGDDAGSDNTDPAPSITSFNAADSIITLGDSTTLTSVFTNGTGVIGDGVGVVDSGVGVTVTPVDTTTYILTVTNSSGVSVSSQKTITVVPAPSITSFSVADSNITIGDSTALTGVFANGTGSIDNGIGVVTSGIDIPVTPTITTPYILTVTNDAGSSVSEQVTISVTPLPPVGPPVPINGITGIWDGTLTWETTGQSKNYAVTMFFNTPDGSTEGTSIGLALGNGPNDIDLPHFLFEGGYVYSADPLVVTDPDTNQPIISCEGDVWAIGRSGQQATFVQEYSYVTGSVGGPDQRGAGCLYLTDADGDGYENELTGQISFEEAGRFDVALTYSEDNVRDVAVTDLGVVGSDQGGYDAPDDVKYHLWSNDNSGNFMNYNATYIDVGDISLTYLVVSEDHPDPVVDCGGLIVVSKIEGQNLFELSLPEDSPVNGCNVATVSGTWEQDGVIYMANDINLPYTGLGALFDLDGDGSLEFVQMMTSKQSGAGSTSQALYNQFVVQ